eukprot:838958-Rhodomonas_salina.1
MGKDRGLRGRERGGNKAFSGYFVAQVRHFVPEVRSRTADSDRQARSRQEEHVRVLGRALPLPLSPS